MSGTTTLGFPYPELTDDPNGAAQMQALAEAVDDYVGSLGAAINSTLPASGVDGQVADIGLGTTSTTSAGGLSGTWRFRYDANRSDAYKWVFIGGPPMFAKIDTTGSINPGGSNNWLDLSGTDVIGPSLVFPVRGYYLIEFGARIDSAGDGQVAQVGMAQHGNDPGDEVTASNANARPASVIGANYPGDSEWLAGGTAQLYYRCSGTGGTANFKYRWIKATPITARP